MTGRKLPEPRTAAGAAGLAAVLAEPARAMVGVDFDGTLAPIVQWPPDARLVEGALAALSALADRVGTVAVVTGRPAEEAVQIGGLHAVPRLHVLGHYGLDRWYDGDTDSPAPSAAIATARERLPALLSDAAAGVHVEDKRHSLAVHTRPAQDPASALAALTPRLQALAAELGLEAVPGRYVLELRPPGVDKGSAVLGVARERAVHAVVYLGDDLGDLPAYAAVDQLRRDGVAGVTVAVVDADAADAPTELAERADLVVDGPEGAVALLDALAAAVGQP